ncbi:hypothetical protein ES703_99443 [subsurface metagenome]
MELVKKALVLVLVLFITCFSGCIDTEGNLLEPKPNRNGMVLELGFEDGLDFDSAIPDYIEIQASFDELNFT